MKTGKKTRKVNGRDIKQLIAKYRLAPTISKFGSSAVLGFPLDR